MTITKQKTPYEFLVRWKDGAIAGAHVRFLETLIETDASGAVTALAEKEGDALPVSVAGEAGFPVADILSVALTTALATIDALQLALAAEVEAHQITKAGAGTPTGDRSVITMRQARLALLGAGLLAGVNDALAAMPGIEGEAARLEWEYATEVRRDSVLVAGLAGVLGLTGAQVDALFIAGARL